MFSQGLVPHQVICMDNLRDRLMFPSQLIISVWNTPVRFLMPAGIADGTSWLMLARECKGWHKRSHSFPYRQSRGLNFRSWGFAYSTHWKTLDKCFSSCHWHSFEVASPIFCQWSHHSPHEHNPQRSSRRGRLCTCTRAQWQMPQAALLSASLFSFCRVLI